MFFSTLFLCLLAPLSSSEVVVEKGAKLTPSRENILLQQYQVTPKVNVVTGEYLEEECDLVVAASDPLSFRRFYSHHCSYHPATNVWRFAPEHFCAGAFVAKEPFVAYGLENGNLYNLDWETNRYAFDPSEGYVHSDVSGRSHPGNTTVTGRRVSQNNGHFYEGQIVTGSGSIKKFRSECYEWESRIKYYDRYRDENAYIETDAWIPYQLPIYEEVKPNGNILCYTYEHIYYSGPERSKYPAYSLPTSITLYNNAKTKILASLKIDHDRAPYGKKGEIVITGSDKRKAILSCEEIFTDDTKEHFKRIAQVTTPSNPSITYVPSPSKKKSEFETKWIFSVERPEGRHFHTQYDRVSNRVKAHWVPIGPNGEMEPLFTYTYQKNQTEVRDALGHKTLYHFDDKKRITQIDNYEKEKLFRRERFKIDPGTGELENHRVEDGKGNLLLFANYRYDTRHNVIEETIGDEKQTYTIHRTFTREQNLIESEWDDFQKKVTYSYKPGTNLCLSECTYEKEKLKKRIMREYDDCAICIKTIVEDGEQTYKRITEIHPRYEQPCFGLPECVTEKTVDGSGNEVLLSKVLYSYTSFGKVLEETHYDSTETLCYTIKNRYDSRERLASTTNALGHKTTFDYDANNNLILIKGPRPDQKKEIEYDKMNRPIVLKKYDGDQLLVIKKGYDRLGRVISVEDECGNQTRYSYNALGALTQIVYPDGGVERKDVDPLGNVIREWDGKGHLTVKKYNFRKQVTEICHPDGSEEGFSYLPNGMIEEHCDRHGALWKITCDIFGNEWEKKALDPLRKVVKCVGATHTPFVKLSDRDGNGNVTHYRYDHAGRKICEEKGDKRITYGYDSWGRENSIDDGATVTRKTFDLLGQLLSEKVCVSGSGKLLRETCYTYDEVGRTGVITSKGLTETSLNAHGLPRFQKDPLGYVTNFSYRYGGGSFIQSERNPNGVTTETTYDFRGHKKGITVKNASGEVIRAVEKIEDVCGNLEEERHHVYDGTKFLKTIRTKWEYGPMQRLERLLEEEGKETLYQYNSRGQLRKTIKPDQIALHYSYDLLGRIAHLAAKEIDYTYRYDGNDAVIEVRDGISGERITRTYDALGHLKEEDYGLKMESYYDDAGRRLTLRLPDGSFIGYSYVGDRLWCVMKGIYAHYYLERDLEGNLTKAQLAGDLGNLTIDYDALCRWKKHSSPYNTSTYTYDSCGNLLSYASNTYAYDDLHQLTRDNAHAYRYDSSNHRLQKDDTNETCNNLGQLSTHTYDQCGNLISDGTATYTYDSLDRLIRIDSKDSHVEYTYDAFHRRLTKKKNGTLEKYIWDGDHEIGSTNASDTITTLRVLGEGLGAEIGAAVLIQINTKTYVPLHDHRGCLTHLIDLSTKIPETYTYTAFGEQNAPSPSPWCFSSKRTDENLIYFGRRHYSPTLGRWLSPDPEGYTHGPNLYTYLNNRLHTHVDLYGLSPRTGTYHSQHEKHQYDETPIYETNGSRIPGFDVGFAPGMLYSRDDCVSGGCYISKLCGGVNVTVLCDVTSGRIKDIMIALALLRGEITPAVLKQREIYMRYFEKNPEKYYLQFCHSRGVAVVRNALILTPEWMRSKIAVIPIAPSCYISKRLCMEAVHLVSKNDIVPKYFDIEGRRECSSSITVLDRHHDEPYFDHSFQSKTYEPFIIHNFSLFYSKYGAQ